MKPLALDAKILRALRAAAPAHVPGAELAAECRADRAELLAQVAELRRAGYEIEEHPHFGFRFLSAPDRLIACDLAGMLEGDEAGTLKGDLAGTLKSVTLGRELVVFEQTGSTNDVAARMGREGAAEGLAVFAESQTAGRGRLGRRWESDAGKGLWFSLLLRPRLPAELWGRLATWAAVGIAEAIEAESGCRTQIKWPNDIYIDAKKVTGILIESYLDPAPAPVGLGRQGFAIVGIGVNVNQTEFPPELKDRAASLRQLTGRAFDRQRLAVAILRSLDAWYAPLEHDFASLLAAAEARSFLKGKWINTTLGGTEISGEALRLDDTGGLVLRLSDGTETTISSGEVTIHW